MLLKGGGGGGEKMNYGWGTKMILYGICTHSYTHTHTRVHTLYIIVCMLKVVIKVKKPACVLRPVNKASVCVLCHMH